MDAQLPLKLNTDLCRSTSLPLNIGIMNCPKIRTANNGNVCPATATAQERIICANAHNTRWTPVFVRTCYREDLNEAYETLIDRDAIAEYGELNDRTLYDGCNWSQILQRIPLLVDTPRMSVLEDAADWDYRHQQDPPTHELPIESLEQADRDDHTLLYVADEEALLERLVKIKWLGLHGQCIWENKIVPGALQSFSGALADGQSLQELVEYFLGQGESQKGGTLCSN
ncbi:hypothetical protein TrVFT333_005448 [Trichoderma virens FT-333]|nr:hypothetical protein TrVFT333_005448 [Trichoderma virens FT-333]